MRDLSGRDWRGPGCVPLSELMAREPGILVYHEGHGWCAWSVMAGESAGTLPEAPHDTLCLLCWQLLLFTGDTATAAALSVEVLCGPASWLPALLSQAPSWVLGSASPDPLLARLSCSSCLPVREDLALLSVGQGPRGASWDLGLAIRF